MATVNTQITDLDVDGQTVTATLTSNRSGARYEIRLDGWAKWRETPAQVELADLRPGDRILTARAVSRRGTVDETPAVVAFKIAEPTTEPPPPPPPEGAWETVRTLAKISDWNVRLIEGLEGASITETGGDIRYFIPGPQTGERCETQTYFGKEGMRCAYDYSFLIPAATRLSTHYSSNPWNIISQHHGNEQAGYTGGVSVYPDGRIALRIKGGDEKSLSGSHEYEYESAIIFGNYKRDTRHHVRLEILWHRDHGEARARLDTGAWQGVTGVPTWPVGQADQNPTTEIMYRHGWYPQGGYVEGDMDIRFGPLTLQTGVL